MTFLEHISRNLTLHQFMICVISVGVRLHVDQVNDAIDILFKSDRDVNRKGLRRQAVVNRFERFPEVTTSLVNLIDKADTWHAVLVRLAPNRLRLRLNAHLAVEHRNRAVKHAKRTLHLGRKVDVTRGVNDVDLVVFPETSHRRRSNRDAALFFLRHPVSGCTRRIIALDLADFVIDTSSVQNTFGCCCFTSVDMRNNTNIAILIE